MAVRPCRLSVELSLVLFVVGGSRRRPYRGRVDQVAGERGASAVPLTVKMSLFPAPAAISTVALRGLCPEPLGALFTETLPVTTGCPADIGSRQSGAVGHPGADGVGGPALVR